MANLFEFGALAERFSLGVMLLDNSLAVQFANRKGCEVWGFKESVELTHKWNSIAKKLALAEKFRGLPKNAAPLQEKLALKLRQNARHVRVEVYPLQHDDCECYLVLAKDRRASEPLDDIWLLASQVQALASLATGIAHDLGAAVNTMQLSLGLFEVAARRVAAGEGEANDAGLGRYATVMREELRRVAGLAHDLPQLIQAPDSSAPAPTDIRRLLENVERWIRHRAAAKQVRRELRLPKVPALAAINANKVELALFNLALALVDNAPSGDILSLDLRVQRRALTVRFRTKQTHFDADLLKIFNGLLMGTANGALPLFASRLTIEAQGGELSFLDAPDVGAGFDVTFRRMLS